jgi:hypothetical protein
VDDEHSCVGSHIYPNTGSLCATSAAHSTSSDLAQIGYVPLHASLYFHAWGKPAPQTLNRVASLFVATS